MKYLSIFIFAAVLSMFSCNENTEADTYIDDELQQVLKSKSENGQLSFFLLPDPNNLEKIPQDINNPLTKTKVELGKMLYHETAFSTEGEFPITKQEYSCASCHHAAAGFQSGLPQAIGEGGQGFGMMGESRIRNAMCAPSLCDVQPIRTPTILNSAFQPLMLWNGQFGATSLNSGTEAQWTAETPKEVNFLGFEGLEIQAIAGLEVHRINYTRESVAEFGYQALFDEVFSEFPEEDRYTRTTAGLAIAAYERTVMAYNAPFQKYLRGNSYALSDFEKEGAILFFSKANCVDCHTGPALNKMEFHALGMKEFDPNSVIHYDPSDPTRFGRFSFTGANEDKFKFKTPQLYNLKDIKFLGHGASFHSVREVLEYKNKAVAENDEVPTSQLSDGFVPLRLSEQELDKLEAFINYALYDNELEGFVPESVLSENCFPNNDEQSQIDLGCK